jgi:putative membrane-bound dehydrogenase-like protein
MKPAPFAWLFAATIAVAVNASAQPKQFDVRQLESHYWSEGAAFGDLNKDGHPDAVYGPYWWEGPAFERRHEIYPPVVTFKTKDGAGKESVLPGFEGALGNRNAYSTDNFFAYVRDFTDDGWNDVLTYGLPGTPAYLYVNPGQGEGYWKRHQVLDKIDNESPTLADLNGDGIPEIVCNHGDEFGFAEPGEDATKAWKFRPVTRGGKWGRFTHGLGVGDVDGDGRADILFKHGWLRQPESLANGAAWQLNDFVFSPGGGAQMYVYDVNGDGLNDVITGLAAHGYGLAWYEQIRTNGKIDFKRHVFMNVDERENRHGVHFSQLHAIELVDVDGDGLKDVVTGKTFWAHGPDKDPEPNKPAVVYWFQLHRTKSGKVEWIPYQIHADSGVGRQIGVLDVNGDGRPDIINGNKKGTFVAIQSDRDAVAPAVKYPAFFDQDLSAKSVITRTGPPRVAAAARAPKTPMAKGGFLPVDSNGKALNLDFEDGTLKDWTPTGDAWAGQPYKGEIDQKRKHGNGRFSLRQGDFWIGGYEVLEDKPKGSLTSRAFMVAAPYAAFRVGGGKRSTTRIELIRKDTGKVIYTASGRDSESMLPVVVDLRAHDGKEIFIRLVDEHDGGWGHVNFDDFRFYPKRPEFSNVVASNAKVQNPVDAALKADKVLHAGLEPQAAVDAMTLPAGFSASVFAAEPDVKQPIAMCLDDRGRIWIAEAYGYPFRQPEGQGKDRILCFEDVDGDGKFDRRSVFMEGLNLVSGLEYGFGGLWVGAAPYLYFIPIQDGDSPRPAGAPRIILEGFAYQDTHETLNSFRWGPDGWLYGCHGVFTHSHVKRHGEPDSTRQFINAGIFRLHPVDHRFEVFAEGTSNPWGIDFNSYGHAFIEACVIPHFWHIFPGGKYQRQAGQHYLSTRSEIARLDPDYWKQDFGAKPRIPLHPHIYDDIKTHGDHLHWLGSRPHAGNAKSDAVGGGHAHAGLMIYQGDSWPAEFRGKALMGNIHGQRINMDIPERHGSGYLGRHGADFLNFNDLWSQALNFRTDQNGSVYLIDWYDQNQCHRREEEVHDRSNGRIYKVIYNSQKWTQIDYAGLDDQGLIQLMEGVNEMPARHARRLLQERAATKKLQSKTRPFLRERLGLDGHPSNSKMLASEVERLRFMWALHVTGGLSETDTLSLLKDSSEYVRAWAVQLACENGVPMESQMEVFAKLAKDDVSPHVRLYLAGALQRLEPGRRMPVLEGLLSHGEDAADHNLPLMYWFAAEPLAGDRAKAIKLLSHSKIPIIRQYLARRMAAK